ncbi:tetracycline resistance MFS efflux pump [Deinococcus irradiatisoli]|uniref:Tetracycline resistance MFS efflux pump n=1 Tax=Deinococcus irradiatisoli TaxID=2202254 RepID=A0A2Z3JKP6_9DEIO|nr:TCR/Tet family MFS transporter [Deinococcus irradiatisoli]AWN23870.1 tetracycline resistance MFS efflux pump [Deinococcus irradiatisoli]
MRRPHAALSFILITALIDIMGIGLIIPVLPLLIKELAGSAAAGARYIGIFTAVYAVMQFVFAPILGRLSDRYGRRPVLLLSLLGVGLDYLLLAFAPTLWWLFVGRVIAGITGASLTVANAYIADVSAPEDRAKNFGRLGATFGVGFILGPALGGLLGGYGLRVPFMFAAGLALLNMLYGVFVLPESLPAGSRGQRLGRQDLNPLQPLAALGAYPLVRNLAGAFILLGMAGQVIFSTWVLYTASVLGWSPVQNGAALAFFGLLTAVVQGGLISTAVRVLGERKAILLGLLLGLAEMLVLAFARSSPVLYVSLVLGALGGLAGPAMQGLISRQVGESEQGRVQGALTGLNSLVGVVGPLLATWVYAYFNGGGAAVRVPGAAFLMGAAFSLLGTVVAWAVLRRVPPRPAPPAPLVEEALSG